MREVPCLTEEEKQIPRFADSTRDHSTGLIGNSWHHTGSVQEKIEGVGDEGLEVLAVDDGVEKAVFEEEFGALKAFGELLPDGLFNDAGAGEADERAGFTDVEVAEHGKAGGDAAGGGIGEHGDVGELLFVETGKGGGDFGKLHQADGALQHARAAGAGDSDERLAGLDGQLDAARDLLADDRAHRTADKTKLHG